MLACRWVGGVMAGFIVGNMGCGGQPPGNAPGVEEEIEVDVQALENCGSPGPDEVIIRRYSNQSGTCRKIGVGNYDYDSLVGWSLNDQISSVSVGSDVKVTLFEHPGFEGDSTSAVTSRALPEFNDIASSVKVQRRRGCGSPGPDQAVVWRYSDFGGECDVLDAGYYSIDRLKNLSVGDDRISAITLGSNMKATLYRDDFAGEQVTFSQTTTLSGASLNDEVSSLRVWHRRNCPAPKSYQVVVDTALLDLPPLFYVPCHTLEVGSYPLALVEPEIGNDNIERVRVGSGVRLWMFDSGGDAGAADFTGVTVQLPPGSNMVLPGSVPNTASSLTVEYDPPRAQSLNDLTASERAHLLALIQKFTTEAIIQEHRESHWHHPDHTLFTGHRGFLAKLENFLRQRGAQRFVPVPYWRPDAPIPSDFTWVKPSYDPLLNTEIATSMWSPDDVCQYTLDQLGARIWRWHSGVHIAVGGAMEDAEVSPSAAIFWPWHETVDTIFDWWLAC
jgi:hypothetical protein